jgi:hypothetical protein
MEGLKTLFIEIVGFFVEFVVDVFMSVIPMDMTEIFTQDFNIYLFSDSGWFGQEGIPLAHLFSFSLVLFAFIFLLRLLWKGTKKFITMVFGVFRV